MWRPRQYGLSLPNVEVEVDGGGLGAVHGVMEVALLQPHVPRGAAPAPARALAPAHQVGVLRLALAAPQLLRLHRGSRHRGGGRGGLG